MPEPMLPADCPSCGVALHTAPFHGGCPLCVGYMEGLLERVEEERAQLRRWDRPVPGLRTQSEADAFAEALVDAARAEHAAEADGRAWAQMLRDAGE